MRVKRFCYNCGNPLTHKHIEDRIRLFCPQCQLPIYENPLPATAAVLLNDLNEVLLVKRNVEPKAGEWCLPGGFVEMGESPEDGCLRELKEETGLKGEIQHWVGNILSKSPVYQWVIVMGYRIKNACGDLKAGDDCSEAKYFSAGELPKIAFRSHQQILKNVLNNIEIQQSQQLRLTDPGCFGPYVITSGDHVALAEKACQAGATIVQYREKKASRQEMVRVAQKIREITRKFGTQLIVNDFLDVALITGADGVHLGQDDIPIAEARKISPAGFIIGRSTHSLEQALEAEKQGADYIGSGPVYATPTKEHYTPIGIEVLKQVVEKVRIPVVAIGGLNLKNIPELIKLGVKNFAMVRAYHENTLFVIQKINQLII